MTTTTPSTALTVPPTTSASTRPLRSDAARNLERILKAAKEVFAERGLDVTLDDIARHAHVGTGTVYRRFADREELIQALFQQRLTDALRRAEAALEHPDPWTGFVRMLEDICQEMSQDRGLRQVMTSSIQGHGTVAGAREQLHPLMEQVVARVRASGAARPDLTATDVPVLLIMIAGVSDFAQDIAPQLWRRYLDFAIEGMRARPGLTEEPVLPLTEADLRAAMHRYQPASRRSLPTADDVGVPRVDEHTALMIDLDVGRASVSGSGVVTVRRRGDSRSLEAGEQLE